MNLRCREFGPCLLKQWHKQNAHLNVPCWFLLNLNLIKDDKDVTRANNQDFDLPGLYQDYYLFHQLQQATNNGHQ